jgi:ABC-type amino acid transport substrate-binding protein
MICSGQAPVHAVGVSLSSKFVHVGYDPDFRPFTFREGDRATGLAIEIVRAVFGRAGHAVEFAPVAHAVQDAALEAGEISAIAFSAATVDRRKRRDFSAPMFLSGGAWYFPAGPASPAGRPPAGACVSTPAKGPLVAEIEADYPDLVVVRVETYPEALQAVLDGRADVAALNYSMGTALARRDFPGRFALPRGPFKPVPAALTVAKGSHAQLLAAFDRALATLKDEGAVAEIESRWLNG